MKKGVPIKLECNCTTVQRTIYADGVNWVEVPNLICSVCYSEIAWSIIEKEDKCQKELKTVKTRLKKFILKLIG